MAQHLINGKVRTLKTHLFVSTGFGDRSGATACGITCWESTYTEEAETARGNRLAITTKPHLVDCEKCSKAAPSLHA